MSAFCPSPNYVKLEDAELVYQQSCCSHYLSKAEASANIRKLVNQEVIIAGTGSRVKIDLLEKHWQYKKCLDFLPTYSIASLILEQMCLIGRAYVIPRTQTAKGISDM